MSSLDDYYKDKVFADRSEYLLQATWITHDGKTINLNMGVEQDLEESLMAMNERFIGEAAIISRMEQVPLTQVFGDHYIYYTAKTESGYLWCRCTSEGFGLVVMGCIEFAPNEDWSIIDAKTVAPPPWLENINHTRDFYRNPTNREFWEYRYACSDSYDGKYIFVVSPSQVWTREDGDVWTLNSYRGLTSLQRNELKMYNSLREMQGMGEIIIGR